MNKELIIEEGTIEDFINIIVIVTKILSNHWLKKLLNNISTFF